MIKKILDLKKDWLIISLIFILCFHFFVNLNYQIKNNTPTTWDESWHTAISFSHYLNLTGHPVNLQNFPLTYDRYIKYPPLVHFVAIPFYFVFGLSENVAAFSITFFFLFSIFFTFLIGKELYDKKIGVLSAILFSFFPIMYGVSRVFLLDLPIVAISSAVIYFLIRYSKTKLFKYLVLSIILIILGTLTKQIFIVFTGIPFVYILYRTNQERLHLLRSDKKWQIILIISLLLIVLTLALYIKLFSGDYLFRIFITNLSLKGFLGGLKELCVSFYTNQTSILTSLFLLLSFANFKKISEKKLFAIWIFVPMFFMALTNIPSGGRYTMPILPAISILIVAYIFSFKNNFYSKIIYLVLIISLLPTFWGLSFGNKTLSAYALQLHSPETQNWKIEKILFDINKINPSATIYTAFNTSYFNPHNFALTAIKNNYNFSIGYYNYDFKKPDYIIIKNKVNSVDIDFKPTLNYISENNLDLIGLYNLPDGSNAGVFKNKK